MEKHTPQENSIEKRKAIINKLMHFVEQSLDTRLSNIERLMEKNKKGLSKAKTEFSKIETIVNIYSESRQSNKISDEIRLFFALARNERLDVISSSNNMEQLRSRSKKAVSHLSRSPGLPSSYNSQFTLKEENKSKKTSFFGTTGRTEEDSRRKSPVFSSSKRTIQEENRSATPKRLQIGTKYEVNMPRTEGKSPRPLEPIANEAIRQSINRLYPKPDPASIANGIAKPTPTSKLLAERVVV